MGSGFEDNWLKLRFSEILKCLWGGGFGVFFDLPLALPKSEMIDYMESLGNEH